MYLCACMYACTVLYCTPIHQDACAQERQARRRVASGAQSTSKASQHAILMKLAPPRTRRYEMCLRNRTTSFHRFAKRFHPAITILFIVESESQTLTRGVGTFQIHLRRCVLQGGFNCHCVPFQIKTPLAPIGTFIRIFQAAILQCEQSLFPVANEMSFFANATRLGWKGFAMW